MDWNRDSVVAGSFYPGKESALRQMLESYYSDNTGESKTPIAIMAPHAGYMYSGKIAGVVYSRVQVPKTVVVLCPNHTGYGKKISVWNKGKWQTPLGDVPVNESLANELLERLGESGDQQAHLSEHAIEVQLPFLQYQRSELDFVPIVLAGLRWEGCQKVAKALVDIIKSRNEEKILLVASTDMSHYIPADHAKDKDSLALKNIESLNGGELYNTVKENNISMCGFIPTATVLEASSLLGAKTAEVLAYGHSGEVSGDNHAVVAYAAAWVY